MSEKNWYVYIIETECGSFYTGITVDIARRFAEHQGLLGKNKGAKFFRGKTAISVRYLEKMENRSIASKREYEIKKLSRVKKQALLGDSDKNCVLRIRQE